MAAWIVGGVGVLLSAWIGTQRFSFSLLEILAWVGVSNLVALVGALLTLRLEKVSWVKSGILAGTARTWTFLTLVYFGSLLVAVPALREFSVLLRMALPLILSTGLMMPGILGPILDQWVRSAQRRERLKSRLAAGQP